MKATISDNQGGTHAGEKIEILADDYTSKGDEELIEVKIGEDTLFIEKKYIVLDDDVLQKDTSEDFTLPELTSVSGVANVKEEDEILQLDDIKLVDKRPSTKPEDNLGIYNEEPKMNDLEVLRAKIKKATADLEDIRSDMKSTFTSTDTISSTITSLKGMIDALKKDQTAN